MDCCSTTIKSTSCTCASCDCTNCTGTCCPSVATVRKCAPEFSAVAYHDGFKNIKLSDYKGKYVVLFFYPLDFTFVCPTEIIQFSDRAKEFREIGAEVIGVSIDSQFSHMEYTKKDRKIGGLGKMDIPLVADVTKSIARSYGCLIEGGEDAGVAFRATYIIDKNLKVRHISISDLPVGRNVDETLRLVKAFQYTDEFGEVCPASWRPGKKTMHADPSSAKTQEYWETAHAAGGEQQ
jgi:peroxiredoxin (alkyl hydroperoxide reductase subunit C)